MNAYSTRTLQTEAYPQARRHCERPLAASKAWREAIQKKFSHAKARRREEEQTLRAFAPSREASCHPCVDACALRERRKERGFSLLEVLVAFVVLALIGTVLFRLFGGALNNAASADAWSRAVQVAQNQLAYASMAQPLQATTDSGKDGDVQWSLLVEPYTPAALEGETTEPAESLNYKLYRLQVDVRFPGVAGKDRTFSLETLKIGLLGQEGGR